MYRYSYNFHLFFQLCDTYLEENLSVMNACDCMQASVTYSQSDLKEKVIIFIEQHTEVRHFMHFTNLSVDLQAISQEEYF